MPYYHRTEIMGTVGRTPELKYSEQGRPRCHFSVFVNESYTADATRERTKILTVYQCVAFGPIAEQASVVLTTGCWVFVCGRIRTHKTEEKEWWSVTVDQFIRLDGERAKRQTKE